MGGVPLRKEVRSSRVYIAYVTATLFSLCHKSS